MLCGSMGIHRRHGTQQKKNQFFKEVKNHAFLVTSYTIHRCIFGWSGCTRHEISFTQIYMVVKGVTF